jgi:hypothetical protein
MAPKVMERLTLILGLAVAAGFAVAWSSVSSVMAGPRRNRDGRFQRTPSRAFSMGALAGPCGPINARCPRS